jgi:hypothetical protein
MPNDLRIDPRDFITGPFSKCPKCGGNEFGVLSIYDERYLRRCRDRACWHTVTIYLPKLKKKVIYIDQSAISNIMKVLSPEVKGHERAAAEPFWDELREALDVVRRLQLAIFPDSTEHEGESLASPFFKSLKNTYEHFSGGVSFYDGESIRSMQIAEAALCFIKRQELTFDLDPQRITRGRVHGWLDRYRVSTDGVLPGTLEELRSARSKGHAELQKAFERWQKEKKTFSEVLEEQQGTYVPFILTQYAADQKKMIRAALGQVPPSLDALIPSAAGSVVEMIRRTLEVESTPAKPAVTVKDFLDSGLIKRVPFNIIESSMFASLAMKAAAGQKEPPNQGTLNDIGVASALLPYCDAMFVDNGCRALLQDIPKERRLPYPCAVFSRNTGAEFLKYVAEIRESATLDHLKVIEELYGPNARGPSAGISGVGTFRR